MLSRIPSPIAPREFANFEESVSVERIIQLYQKRYQLDVRPYFQGVEKLQIFSCEKTHFRFFYPYTVAGDGNFYAHFQQYDWYYIPWKWEHEVTCSFLKGEEKILEVGSGSGGFISGLQQRHPNVQAIGLELNPKAIAEANHKKVAILPESIQNHAMSHLSEYDMVCSFQVLEHIPEPYTFLKAQIDALKVGGKLIICVPNNDSFIKEDIDNILNMPPHHMGLWNAKSLQNLTNVFPLRSIAVLFEPLQPHHYDFYLTVQVKKQFGALLGGIFYRLLQVGFKKLFYPFLERKAAEIHGHSILIVFEKLSTQNVNTRN
ncbi:MAG: class I SAM-dependent methyltransferase [Bacteroidia bacterium]|nr:class I SAM-dependent methyltransferase [Bacteroidia bacterium]